jgi:5-methylcytosine-specific restriction endonuclease McrA
MAIAVLNPPDDKVLHIVPLRKAIALLRRNVVEIVEVEDGSTFGPYVVPRVLRLTRAVSIVSQLEGRRPVFSKAGVLRRDRFTCAYCGRSATTVDHVVPRARGGRSSWLNLVAACRPCNQAKADKSLRDCDMRLQFLPYEPDWI